METLQNKNTQNTDDEIDLIEVFKKIWAERVIILKITAIFFIVGIVIALVSPKEYKSEIKLLVVEQGSSGVSGLLSQFGGLAGLNFGGNAKSDQAITPDLFPEIIESTPFQLNLLDQKLYISNLDTTVKLYTYFAELTKPSGLDYIKKFTIGLPSTIVGAFQSKQSETTSQLPDTITDISEPLNINPKKISIANSLVGRIKVKEGLTSGVLLLTVEMPDANAAAELTTKVVKLLTQYIINFRIQKVKADLEFITQQHKQAEIRYFNAQQRYAQFQDANRGIYLATARTEGERLQSEYNLAYNVYNGLSQQLEQAKMKVQEKTPSIKILNPAKIPQQKSKPKTAIIILVTSLLGGIIATSYVIVKIIVKNIKTNNIS